jgi:hypothetical protein
VSLSPFESPPGCLALYSHAGSSSDTYTGRAQPKGNLHWVAAADAVDVEVRCYGALFTVAEPDPERWREQVTRAALSLSLCRASVSLTYSLILCFKLTYTHTNTSTGRETHTQIHICRAVTYVCTLTPQTQVNADSLEVFRHAKGDPELAKAAPGTAYQVRGFGRPRMRPECVLGLSASGSTIL